MRTIFGKLALMLAIALLATGCATTGGGATKAALCDQFRPVRWSSADTPETIMQVKGNNAVGASVCGWKAK